MKNKLNEIIIQNKKYHVIINRKKIKHTYIRINNEYDIIVSTNAYTTLTQIENLIIKNQNKIIKMVHNKKRQILPDNKIAYLGKIYPFKIIINKKFAYNIEKNNILFYTSYQTDETKALFYKLKAKELLPERLQKCYRHFIQFYDIPYPELSMRKMKRRYGTCYYKRKQINLNTYLMKYDIETIDYVIYHELSHFIQQNHSPKFYQVLEEVCPDHMKLRKNLNKYE